MTERMQEASIATVNRPHSADPTVLLRGGEALPVTPVPDRLVLIPADGVAPTDILAILTDMQDWDQSASPTIRPIGAAVLALHLDNPSTAPSTDLPLPDRLDQLIHRLQASGLVRFVSPVYALAGSPGSLIYPIDQITLQFQAGLTSEQMQQITQPAGLQILKLVAGIAKTFVFQVATDPLKLAVQLSRSPALLRVEPNVAIMRQPCYRPRDSDYRQQWYLQNEGGEGLAAGSHIFAEAAWNLGRGKRSIAVAVVDGAIDLSHADFQSEGKLVGPVDFRPSSVEPEVEPEKDASGHGTAVAQIAVADETGKGLVGVAPGCALMPIQLGDYFDDQTIEQVSQWAIDQGADVVCWSWQAAAVQFPLSLRQQVALSQLATQGREGRGTVLIVAAGNADRPIDGVVQEPGDWQAEGGALQPTRWLNGFAVHPDSIAVAACTSLNQKSAASNWGNGIALAAPGGQSAPSLRTEGRTLSIAAEDLTGQPSLRLDQPLPIGGTSGASAIVAGVAALILSINPDLTALQVRQILEQTADRILDRRALESSESSPESSPGRYDEDRYSVWFGYGKVNAVKAVQLAQQLIVPMPLPYRWLEFPNRQRLEIPDGDPAGITSSITVSETAPICDLEIILEIEHGFLGDLIIALIPPWGMPIPLQSRSLGRLTRLNATYSPENSLWLKSALNRSPQGVWQLHIIDAIPAQTGYLQQWQLNLGV